MNILHIYKDYSPVLGGIENHLRMLAERQAAAGHAVTVLVTNPGGQRRREVIERVEVLRLPRLGTVASTPLSVGFPGAIRRMAPDITHLHFPYPVGELGQLLGGRGRPYVVTYHSDVVRQQAVLRMYMPVLNRVLDGAARILPTSENYIRSSPFLRARRERCSVVGLGVDPRRFSGAGSLVAPAEIPTVLFVGRHRYYKGVDDLIRAMVGVRARLLVGGDGPMRAHWERLAAEVGLGARAVFTGEVSDADLPGLYASADVFVLPANSRAEAFGQVLLEAMASGLPCVTTELGTGTSFVVRDGETGLVVPSHAPEALRIAISDLLEDPGRRAGMGAAGRTRVLDAFTPERMVARVQGIYEEVLHAS
ncbi:MAG TPA: glycosyltransferase [Anaerolineales bacterium]|nr:glycosyltransferase [Anaerolineales bacterium]